MQIQKSGKLTSREMQNTTEDIMNQIFQAQKDGVDLRELTKEMVFGEPVGTEYDCTHMSAEQLTTSQINMLRNIYDDKGTWEDSIAKSKKTIGFLVSVVRGSNFLNHEDDYRKMLDPAKIAEKIDAKIEWARSKGYKDTVKELRETRQARIDEQMKYLREDIEREIGWAESEKYNNMYQLGLAPSVAGASLYKDENGNLKINAFQQKDNQGRVVAEMKEDGTVTMYNEDGSVRETQTRQQLAIYHDSHGAGACLDLGYFIDLTDEQLSVYW